MLATDEHALTKEHLQEIHRITRTHPLTLIDVATANPFAAAAGATVTDALSGRRLPAFLRDKHAAAEVNTHREYMAAALERELSHMGGQIIHAGSQRSRVQRFHTDWCRVRWRRIPAIWLRLHRTGRRQPMNIHMIASALAPHSPISVLAVDTNDLQPVASWTSPRR